MGVDLYFPKIGTEPSATRGNATTIERFESTNTVPMVSAGRVRQIILANGKETAIARTVRGFNIISGEKFTGLMAGLQAATELLPDTEPRLPDGKQGGSTAIDATLLLAANNNRVPENSLTAYSTGLGRGLTPSKGISTASYQGIWFGFSPTVERRVTIKEASFSAIGYLNPDPEYFTKLAGSMTKFVALGRNPLYNLNLTAGFNYAVDGTKIFDAVSFRSANSYLNFGATANLDRIALGTTLFLPTGLSNSIGTLISTSASWRIAEGIAVSAFYTPTNNNSFRSPFGANASIRLGAAPASPTLSLGWNRNDIDLGTLANTRAGVIDNVFSFLLRFDGFR